MFEPLRGRRDVLVTERRTAQDDAHAIRHPIDVVSPAAEKIVLVRDNLPNQRTRHTKIDAPLGVVGRTG